QELREVEVPGTGNVALARVARVARLAGELDGGTHVEQRDARVAEPGEQLVECHVHRSGKSTRTVAKRVMRPFSVRAAGSAPPGSRTGRTPRRGRVPRRSWASSRQGSSGRAPCG